MEKNLLISIQASYPALSKVGQKIAAYILENPEHVINQSVQQMAKELSVAEASIIRFCRAIGVSGFSELKLQLAKESGGRPLPATVFEEIGETDSVEAIARNVFLRNLSTLQTAMEELDFSAVHAAAELLKEAGHIVICGTGLSASIAENFCAHLRCAGMPAVVSTDVELMQIEACLAGPETVFVAISRGGRTTALIKAFKEARKHRAKTISITAHRHTPLYDASDVNIVHYAPSVAMVSTRIVQNTIVDCLHICATRHRRQEVTEQIAENRKLLEFMRTK